ncbi:hypothetical protein COV18_04325 [Candidatus Woesearchaeota archaeon CG10_big_fil_rev_8_21_14_0_10_37_12]|nr:MAG: hypothetical protein COV18_04325 [Candidatus Woesearchaeota archaeon CG10_big_fil_rev_8_21_14_0_10_37_12]
MSWEESEEDWGVRPDGSSLHLSQNDYHRYIKEYWRKMPDDVPCEYSRPAGSLCEAQVTDSLYQRILDKSREYPYGLRVFDERQLEGQIMLGKQRSGWMKLGGDLSGRL